MDSSRREKLAATPVIFVAVMVLAWFGYMVSVVISESDEDARNKPSINEALVYSPTHRMAADGLTRDTSPPWLGDEGGKFSNWKLRRSSATP